MPCLIVVRRSTVYRNFSGNSRGAHVKVHTRPHRIISKIAGGLFRDESKNFVDAILFSL